MRRLTDVKRRAEAIMGPGILVKLFAVPRGDIQSVDDPKPTLWIVGSPNTIKWTPRISRDAHKASAIATNKASHGARVSASRPRVKAKVNRGKASRKKEQGSLETGGRNMTEQQVQEDHSGSDDTNDEQEVREDEEDEEDDAGEYDAGVDVVEDDIVEAPNDSEGEEDLEEGDSDQEGKTVSLTRTSMTQKSKIMIGTTEHRKKMSRRQQTRRKMKKSRLKQIWQKMLEKQASKKQKDSRKQQERAKAKERRRRVARQGLIVEPKGTMVQPMMSKRKNMEVRRKWENPREIRSRCKESRMVWDNEGQHTTATDLGGVGKREICMAKKAKKAARILTKERERRETEKEALEETEGSELRERTKPWITHRSKNTQTSAVRLTEGRMKMTQPRTTHSVRQMAWTYKHDQEHRRSSLLPLLPQKRSKLSARSVWYLGWKALKVQSGMPPGETPSSLHSVGQIRKKWFVQQCLLPVRRVSKSFSALCATRAGTQSKTVKAWNLSLISAPLNLMQIHETPTAH
jgi:hypothetical protein